MTVPSFTEAEKIVRKLGLYPVLSPEVLAEFGIHFMREAIAATQEQYVSKTSADYGCNELVDGAMDEPYGPAKYAATQEQPPIMKKRFEYKVYMHFTERASPDEAFALIKAHETKMNQLGMDGWELVAIVRLGGAFRYEFKRELEGVT